MNTPFQLLAPFDVDEPVSKISERDLKAMEMVLESLFYGGTPEILFDSVSGWELYMDDHSAYFPLETSLTAVNMILKGLADCYRRTSTEVAQPHNMWSV